MHQMWKLGQPSESTRTTSERSGGSLEKPAGVSLTNAQNVSKHPCVSECHLANKSQDGLVAGTSFIEKNICAALIPSQEATGTRAMLVALQSLGNVLAKPAGCTAPDCSNDLGKPSCSKGRGRTPTVVHPAHGSVCCASALASAVCTYCTVLSLLPLHPPLPLLPCWCGCRVPVRMPCS